MTAQPDLFDRSFFRTCRLRALMAAKPGADFLLKAVSEDLQDRLLLVNRRFPVAVDLGGHCAHVSEAIRQSGKADLVLRADLFAADPSLELAGHASTDQDATLIHGLKPVTLYQPRL